MSKALRSHLQYLNFLNTATKQQRLGIIKASSIDQINILSEIVKNLLQGNVSISTIDQMALRNTELFTCYIWFQNKH